VKAVLLVGGEGTRLRPLTWSAPKPLLPIANQPLVERQLDWLRAHGVTEVVLSLGYLPDNFRRQFPDDCYRGVQLRYAVESQPLNTAGALRFALPDADETFVVCNGDVLTTLDLSALVQFHRERRADATIHLAEVDDPSAFGVAPTDADGRVLAFVEKPPPGEAPSRWINAGTYVLEPRVLEGIPRDVPVSIERETFPQLLEDGRGAVYGFQSRAYWLDVGTPASYLAAHAAVLAGRLGTPPVAGARQLRPSVWVQGSPVVADQALVVGAALIGDGARVEAGAVVEDSVLVARCVVEKGARVTRSVLLDGAQLQAHAQALDAVVGPEAVLDSYAVVSEQTIVGARAVVAAGSTAAGVRIAVVP